MKLLIVLIFLLGCLTPISSLQCFVGTSGASPPVNDCPSGTCARYIQNNGVTLGCFTMQYCQTLQDAECCQTDLCNGGNLIFCPEIIIFI